MDIALCETCGFVTQNPRVSEEDWKAYYETGVYDKYHRPRPTKENGASNDTARITYQRIMDFLDRQYTREGESDSVLENIGCATRVLEVGAGDGSIIETFKGMTLYAIEPLASCRAICQKKGITVLNELKDTTGPDMPMFFDVIIIRHVLEHIYYPKNMVEEMIRLLGSRGILYIAVPDFLSPNSLKSFTYPHISYFTPYSLQLLCQLVISGLEVSKIQSAGDEVWCILKKRTSKDSPDFFDRSCQDLTGLMNLNISATMNHLKKFGKALNLRKRRALRMVSNLMPVRVLSLVYERRNKNIV